MQAGLHGTWDEESRQPRCTCNHQGYNNTNVASTGLPRVMIPGRWPRVVHLGEHSVILQEQHASCIYCIGFFDSPQFGGHSEVYCNYFDHNCRDMCHGEFSAWPLSCRYRRARSQRPNHRAKAFLRARCGNNLGGFGRERV